MFSHPSFIEYNTVKTGIYKVQQQTVTKSRPTANTLKCLKDNPTTFQTYNNVLRPNEPQKLSRDGSFMQIKNKITHLYKPIGNPCGKDEYLLFRFEMLVSTRFHYYVDEYLGRGTFGQVVAVVQHETTRKMALKILKKTPTYTRQGLYEISLLKLINQNNEQSLKDSHLVTFLDNFEHNGHICIVFELLSINLYDFMRINAFNPIPLYGIRAISFQVLKALIKLSALGIVHSDLKPENIMLVDHKKYPYRIKVIDFGSAFYQNRGNAALYVQSRYYRAPEVILGCGFGIPIDMWSLGCIMAELVTGWAIFPGSNQYEQIRYICSACDQPSETMLSTGENTLQFFDKNNNWNLIDPSKYSAQTGNTVKNPSKYSIKNLNHIQNMMVKFNKIFLAPLETYIEEINNFVFALKKMLQVDPRQRLSPNDAVTLPFWNFIPYVRPNSNWFVRSIQVMYSSSAWPSPEHAPVPMHPWFLSPSNIILAENIYHKKNNMQSVPAICQFCRGPLLKCHGLCVSNPHLIKSHVDNHNIQMSRHFNRFPNVPNSMLKYPRI